jgi:hypothetical protein
VSGTSSDSALCCTYMAGAEVVEVALVFPPHVDLFDVRLCVDLFDAGADARPRCEQLHERGERPASDGVDGLEGRRVHGLCGHGEDLQTLQELRSERPLRFRVLLGHQIGAGVWLLSSGRSLSALVDGLGDA